MTKWVVSSGSPLKATVVEADNAEAALQNAVNTGVVLSTVTNISMWPEFEVIAPPPPPPPSPYVEYF